MRKKIFVTGGTGFIGRGLVRALLSRGIQLFLLVRPNSMERHGHLLAEFRHQAGGASSSLEIVQGDLCGDLGHVRSSLPYDLDAVFHLAALYDLGATRERLMEVNVEGTRKLLNLLRELEFGGTLHYVSSVAVAGDHQGRFTEEMFQCGQKFQHPYNRSKFEAEKLVRRIADVPVRIYRPSAVVGNSMTGESPRLDGPTVLFPILEKLRRWLPPSAPLVAFPLGGRLNMVPVDFVVAAMDRIAHLPGLDGKTFHIVDPRPLPTEKSLTALLEATGGPRIRWVLPADPALLFPGIADTIRESGAARMLLHQILAGEGIPPSILDARVDGARFRCANTVAALEGSGIQCPPLPDYVDRLWRYYEEHLSPARNVDARRGQALSGRRIVITGASSGIGRATAHLCARHGARLILVARRKEKLQELCQEIEPLAGTATAYPCDLSDGDACDELISAVLDREGGIDVLFNNAGHSIRRPLDQSFHRFHDFERLMRINYFPAVRLTLGFLPGMVERRDGHILHSSTMGTMGPSPRFAAYLPTKCAFDAFCDCLAAEYADRGIAATRLHFPLVRTEMISPTAEYAGAKAMSPKEAAEIVIDAIVERPRQVLPPLGYVMRLSALFGPRFYSQVLNLLHHLWPAGEDLHPELEPDRNLARLLFPAPII